MHVLPEKGTTEPQALSRGEKIELALIMLLAAALRAAFLLHQSLTEDEVKDLQIAHKPLSGIFSFSDGFPPLYNSILHVWLGFTSSPYAGRWLGVIFGVIAVGLLWQVGRRLGTTSGTGAISLMPAGGGPQEQVVRFEDPAGPSSRPEWSMGHGRIYYTTETRQADEWVMEVGGEVGHTSPIEVPRLRLLPRGSLAGRSARAPFGHA